MNKLVYKDQVLCLKLKKIKKRLPTKFQTVLFKHFKWEPEVEAQIWRQSIKNLSELVQNVTQFTKWSNP